MNEKIFIFTLVLKKSIFDVDQIAKYLEPKMVVRCVALTL